MMAKLWQQRLQNHQREMLKYLRLVFNEFFMIAVFILLGGLAYAYSNSLKTITAPLWWAKGAVLVILLVTLSLGHLATLVENADTVFLLPKETSFSEYLVRARRYSLILPDLLSLVIVGFLLPFLQVGANLPVISGLWLYLSLIGLKDSQLWLQLIALYERDSHTSRNRSIIFYGLATITFAVSLWINPILGFVLTLAVVFLGRFLAKRFLVGHILQWSVCLTTESSRMLQMYRIFNLFTDVPQLRGKVRRRRYLDGLLRLIQAKHENTYQYLYWRGFLRGTEYSGLFIRLTVLGAIILFFVKTWWLALLIAALFIYLTGAQIVPFYTTYEEIVFTHLYPIENKSRLKAFKQLITVLLIIESVIFSLVLLISLPTITIWLVATLVIVAIDFWFVQRYLKQKIAP
ncbi:ABC transporter permease [Loigolactobacillus iwatensis]|uniref:ABC transporter permease n=1 Tax=Loigolactobacillus iwatensis TaxID=1267156 RepID=UPI000F7E887D|nr:ABC transporter permease [Loigolactobacillus iwatensis]